jgi:mono/diheme cytochrome c family protein
MRRRLTLIAVVVAVLLLVALISAGCTDAPRTGKDGSAEPTGTKLTGEQLVKTKCVYCHNDDRIDTATYDQAGWEDVIDRMDEKGAQVNEAEKAVIAEYLANR